MTLHCQSGTWSVLAMHARAHTYTPPLWSVEYTHYWLGSSELKDCQDVKLHIGLAQFVIFLLWRGEGEFWNTILMKIMLWKWGKSLILWLRQSEHQCHRLKSSNSDNQNTNVTDLRVQTQTIWTPMSQTWEFKLRQSEHRLESLNSVHRIYKQPVSYVVIR